MRKKSQMGYLQDFGMNYAEHLMRNYDDKNCALRIENWRNRKTRASGRDKIENNYPFLNKKQRQQVVNYAKKYIYPMISKYLIKISL